MLRTQIAICTKRAIQDSQENMLSLVDVIEEINSPAFPFIIPRLSVVWVLEREANDPPTAAGSIVFFNGTQQLNEFPLEIDFQQSNRTRAIFVIAGVAIQQPGTLRISFRLNGTEQSSYAFPVIAQAQQIQTGGQPAVVM